MCHQFRDEIDPAIVIFSNFSNTVHAAYTNMISIKMHTNCTFYLIVVSFECIANCINLLSSLVIYTHKKQDSMIWVYSACLINR